MDTLMADLTSNQKLRPIIDDNEADVALWNKVSRLATLAVYNQALTLHARKSPNSSKEKVKKNFAYFSRVLTKHTFDDDRLHECTLAFRRSVQVPPPERMLLRQQVLEGTLSQNDVNIDRSHPDPDPNFPT